MNTALAEKQAGNEERFSLVAVGSKMRRVLEAADDVAGTNATVLLVGESGTGKEVLSRYIHSRSPRANSSWVAVNCAALPGELLEAELFGYEKGAFTGAAQRHKGRIEQAHGGTLLLDEISEMPLLLQAKLLRVLQEREVQRVGGSGVVSVDVRVIATSNRDLPKMVAEGRFRADLYYRINVFPIELPALRERPEEIPALAETLLARAADRIGRELPRLSADAMDALVNHPLPGNARELSNVLERALIRAQGRPIIQVADLDLPQASMLQLVHREMAQAQLGGATVAPPTMVNPGAVMGQPAQPQAVAIPPVRGAQPIALGEDLDLSRLERRAILEALRRTEGNRTHAAKMLGIGLRTLRNKLRAMREADCDVPEPSSGTRLVYAEEMS